MILLIIVVYISGVPSAPGQPYSLETSEDSIHLAWTRPDSTGGSPILGYVVEKREAGSGTWSKASFALVPDLKYRVHGLTPHKTYEFRVCAVNAAGNVSLTNQM